MTSGMPHSTAEPIRSDFDDEPKSPFLHREVAPELKFQLTPVLFGDYFVRQSFPDVSD